MKKKRGVALRSVRVFVVGRGCGGGSCHSSGGRDLYGADGGLDEGGGLGRVELSEVGVDNLQRRRTATHF